MTAPVPLSRQIGEVMRELGQRRKVYPGLVKRGTYRQSEVDFLIESMDGVLKTLRWLSANEDEIRAFLALPAEARHAVLERGPTLADMCLRLAEKERSAKAGGPVR
jgi:hypothetical protein